MGHADIRTTQGYLHLVRENLRVLVPQVDAGGSLAALANHPDPHIRELVAALNRLTSMVRIA